jgi:organic hydroperoxide reductase OsmC/OhrA
MSEEEHRYEMNSKWVRDKIVTIEIDGKNSFHVATPPDFWPEGPHDVVSPEDLFLASAVSCYGVSLYGVSKRFHAELNDFQVTGVGTLQRGEYGWEFEQITITARIFVPTSSDKKKMSKAAERAHTYCVVTNSMKCPVHLKYEIIVG